MADSQQAVQMADIHTHVLFHIDDGPKTLEDSLELLRSSVASGVTDIVATSHYYSAHMPPEEFIERREKRLSELRQAVKEQQIPVRLYHGAEVYINSLLLNLPSLSDFCFEGTKNILLEIPHTAENLNENLQLIDRILSYYRVRPVIAHVERYGFFFKKMKNLAYLHDMGCVIQADTRCFLEGFREKMFAYKALKDGYIDVIASDCHNVTDRPPELAKAYAAIAKKAGEEAVELLKQNAAALLPHTL